MTIDQAMKLPVQCFIADTIQIDRFEKGETPLLKISTNPGDGVMTYSFDLTKSEITTNLSQRDAKNIEMVDWKIKQGATSIRLKGKYHNDVFKGSIFITVFRFFPAYWSLVECQSRQIHLLAEIGENN